MTETTELPDFTHDFNRALLNFIDRSPSPFHAVQEVRRTLDEVGFVRLPAEADWRTLDSAALDRCYVVRNDSSIIVLSGLASFGDAASLEKGLRLYGAHTDSPCLKIKPRPAISRHGAAQLGVEVYGGALLNPWFDRDLSIAGRVVVRTEAGDQRSVLIDFRRALAIVPSLAIHLDREVNQNRSINPQKHLPPVLSLASSKDGFSQEDFCTILLDQVRSEADGFTPAEVLSWELCLYDTQPGAVIGLRSEILASARLDNLLSCHIGLRALLDAPKPQPSVLVFSDHEEVGSQSAEGAQGNFLPSTIQRMLAAVQSEGDSEDVFARTQRLLERSIMISADNAHAIHPNYPDRHDENHGPELNKGPVIKINHNQRYATNAVTAAFYEDLAAECGLPWQSFVVRSDMACGSTIGPITAANIGIKTLDIGVPQWGMHSVRETCGSADPFNLYTVMKSYFGAGQLP